MGLSKKDGDMPNYTTSFSSYLAMRTKSPARPPMSRTQSVPESSTVPTKDTKTSKPTTNVIKPATTTTTKEENGTDYTPKSSLLSSRLSSAKEEVTSRLSSTKETKPTSTSTSVNESASKPPRPPVRLKEKMTGSKLGEINESTQPKEEKPKKIIQSLRGDSNKEVKDDETADVSYVVSLGKKKDKKVEYDLQSEVDRLKKDTSDLNKLLKEMKEENERLESENKEYQSSKKNLKIW